MVSVGHPQELHWHSPSDFHLQERDIRLPGDMSSNACRGWDGGSPSAGGPGGCPQAYKQWHIMDFCQGVRRTDESHKADAFSHIESGTYQARKETVLFDQHLALRKPQFWTRTSRSYLKSKYSAQPAAGSRLKNISLLCP